MNDEKFTNKILGIFVCFMYTFIALFVLFVIGICRVDALTSSTIGFAYKDNLSTTSHLSYNTNFSQSWDPTTEVNTYYPFIDVIYNFQQGHSYSIKVAISYNYNNAIVSNTASYVMSPYAIFKNINHTGSNLDISSYHLTDTYFTRYSGSVTPQFNTYREFNVSYIPTSNSSSFGVVFSLTCSPDNHFKCTNSDYQYWQFDITQLDVIDNGQVSSDKNTAEIQDSINNATNEIIDNQNQNTDKVIDAIDDFFNQGSLNDNTQPDDSKLNDYNDAEGNLIDKDTLDNINNIEISIDSDSNAFIWNLVDRILNTHTLILGLVITMLSIGIIKLVLNR